MHTPLPKSWALTGPLRPVVLRQLPGFVCGDEVDVAAARALSAVAPGACVRAFIGTWCRTSRPQIARLLRALEYAPIGALPWSLELIGVDCDMTAPNITEVVHALPTFIVVREGREVGRIVGAARNGIERDLLAALRG